MPRTGDNIHIPLSEEEALRLAFKVKPANDMPRPGANPTTTTKKSPSPKRDLYKGRGREKKGRGGSKKR